MKMRRTKTKGKSKRNERNGVVEVTKEEVAKRWSLVTKEFSG